MYNRVLRVCNYDTSTPLLPYKAVVRSYMASKFGSNTSFEDDSLKNKNKDHNTNVFRHVCPSPESFKIRSKVRSLCYNSYGNRLYISTRDCVYFYNTQWMGLEHTLSIRSTTLLAHPKSPDVFALLVQGSSYNKPSVKIFELRARQSKGHRHDLVGLCTITSAFGENWYTGCWSQDGKYIALVDKDDVLQVVEFQDGYKDQQLNEQDSLRLESEAYGIIYTSDYLVVHRVDGLIQIFSPDLKSFTTERAHSHIVTASAFDNNFNLLATGGSDHVVNVFDVDSGMVCVGTFPRLEGQVSSLSFSSDGVFLAWGTKDSAPCPIDDVTTLQSTLDQNQSGFHDNEEAHSPEFCVTVAGVDPYEIYYQHSTPCAVAHVAFSPNKHVLAYACDYDTFPKGGNNSHNNLVGFLYL